MHSHRILCTYGIEANTFLLVGKFSHTDCTYFALHPYQRLKMAIQIAQYNNSFCVYNCSSGNELLSMYVYGLTTAKMVKIHLGTLISFGQKVTVPVETYSLNFFLCKVIVS